MDKEKLLDVLKAVNNLIENPEDFEQDTLKDLQNDVNGFIIELESFGG